MLTCIDVMLINRVSTAMDLAARVVHNTPVTIGDSGVDQLELSTHVSVDIEDGWLLGPNGELVLWLPHEYRKYFGIFPKIKTLGRPDAIADFRGFSAHGTEWVKCYSPRSQ